MRSCSLDTSSITVVGCGDVRLATAAARGLDANDVARAVHEALELGITLVEAAEDAERLCGDAIRALRLRDAVVLASRVALPDRTPFAAVQQRVEATLRATRLDAIPLAQLELTPTWRASNRWLELAGTCDRLVREGKVMRWGAYLAEPVELEPWLVTANVEFNACCKTTLLDNRDAAPYPRTTDRERLVLARHPLAGGALAGTLGPGVVLAKHDDRRALDTPTLERIATLVATLAPLVAHEPACARSCEAAKAALDRGRRTLDVEAATLAELALRYVIDRGAIALPRLHRRQHPAEAVAAANAPALSRAIIDRVEAVTRTDRE